MPTTEHPPVPARTLLAWTWPLRLVPVVACQLCAALLAADGADAHARWHVSITDRAGS